MKNPNSKLQIPGKNQIPTSHARLTPNDLLRFGAWNLFGIWNLGFGFSPAGSLS
jgi:hypothetical protein